MVAVHFLSTSCPLYCPLFRIGRVRLTAVAVATPSLEVGPPVGLMTTTRESGDPFAVNHDESRVLWVMRPEGFADSPPLTVVRNWELLLER